MTEKNWTGNTGGGTPTTGGNLFGASSTAAAGNDSTTNPPGTALPSLFGNTSSTTLGGTASGTGPFGTPKPAEQGSTTPAPKVSNFFSTTSTSTPSVFGSTAGGLFGPSLKPMDNAIKPTTTPSTTPGGGISLDGGLFGKKPETATSTAPSTTTPAAPPLSVFSLSGNKDTATITTTTTTTAPSGGLFANLGANKDSSAATTTAPPAFNLFAPPKDATSEKKDATAASAPFSLGVPSTSKDSGKQPAVATSASAAEPATSNATTAIAVPPPSALRGKSIEDIVNKWSTELETHVREFNKFAGEVAVWDRALIENGNNLAALYGHVLAAEREQNEIDQALDHIEQQQKDLAATLEAYEKTTQEILGGQGGSLRALDTGPADTERDKNYVLATDLHTHLDDLSTSLTQIIESVNSLSQPPSTSADSATKGLTVGEDPMAQISQILSSHLESLQWIDGAVREVEGKVTEIERRVKESGGGTVIPSGNGPKHRSGFGLNR